MSGRCIVSPRAESDLIEIGAYVAKRDPVAAASPLVTPPACEPSPAPHRNDSAGFLP